MPAAFAEYREALRIDPNFAEAHLGLGQALGDMGRIYAAIVEWEMDRLVDRVTEGLSHGTPRERFEAAVLAFMTYAKEEPAGFAVLTRDSPTASARDSTGTGAVRTASQSQGR